MKTKKALILFISLLLCVGLTGYYYYNLSRKKETVNQSLKQNFQKKESVIYKDKDSTTHIVQEVVPMVVESKKEDITNIIENHSYSSYVKDTLAPALKIATEKIQELTRVKAKLEGELQATKVELAENKAKRVYYEDKYLSIVTHEDSTGSPKKLQYTYNAELNITHYSKRKNFWNKERNYIDVSSPDKNFKINGLEHYQKQIYIRPKQVGIGFQFGYGLTQDFKVQPYMGVGLSYNLIRF
ncbi:DUF6808 domain-containing protein [Bergeyella zoohelcum]|uniref:DUF6808 domain-containing protein n=1 Tax=Bergeyella zoohelcum TaxID=1015 RepID=A0A7Z8YR59_9FLAO|nr:hypothetical protein [Bergeyella zoohelcum]MDY6025962.1 hypothetical protein [Bergeyella zoohelcum]VDH05852.1 Uncharacterised protein [Bergeyella zoohelcum]